MSREKKTRLTKDDKIHALVDLYLDSLGYDPYSLVHGMDSLVKIISPEELIQMGHENTVKAYQAELAFNEFWDSCCDDFSAEKSDEITEEPGSAEAE